MGFLDKVTALILDNYPTYKAWAESIGFYLLVNVSYKAYLPGGGKGIPLTFNPWVIGPSRLAFKSTSSSIIKPMLKECGILTKGDFTTEKFRTWAHKVTEEHPDDMFHCAIVRDETSGLVAQGVKKYMADQLTFLSQLLDPGVVPAQDTQTHGSEDDLPCRVNFITACTPQVFSIIDESFWTQGLGNRLVAIYITEKILQEMLSLPHAMSGEIYESRLQECIALLKIHAETCVKKIRYADDVAEKVQQTEYIKRTRAYKDYFANIFSIMPSYEYESQVMTQKIAALKAIDRQPTVEEPLVEMCDYIWAENWVKDRLDEFVIIYDKWKESKERNLFNNRNLSLEEKILAWIDKYGKITGTELNNNIKGASSGERMKAIDNLRDSGVIVYIPESTGNKVRRTWSRAKQVV